MSRPPSTAQLQLLALLADRATSRRWYEMAHATVRACLRRGWVEWDTTQKQPWQNPGLLHLTPAGREILAQHQQDEQVAETLEPSGT